MKTIIVCGPTGVGKSEWAESYAIAHGCEIVNVDMGQLYEPLSIGTAKPCMKSVRVRHHLYGVIKTPEDMDIVRYREMAIEKVSMISDQGKGSVIVGGSMFYVEGLIYKMAHVPRAKEDADSRGTWEELAKIDPVRANNIHKSDTYRINRALSIWKNHGIKPSACSPIYDPIEKNIEVIWLCRDKDDLEERIDLRVDKMLGDGWVEEVSQLSREWKEFVRKKRLCGYNIIVEGLENGISCETQKAKIKKETRAYAKRQVKYWKRLSKKLSETIIKSDVHQVKLN